MYWLVFVVIVLNDECTKDLHYAYVGETGLGKSTLMDSLFNTNFESNPAPHTLPHVKLKAHTYELQESNVRLKVRGLYCHKFSDFVDEFS